MVGVESSIRSIAAVVVAFVLAGSAPTRADDANECLVQLQGDGTVAVEDGGRMPCCAPYCTKSANGKRCTFKLRACRNEADFACAPADLKRVVAKSKCGGSKALRLAPGDGPSCGDFADVVVRTKKGNAGECVLSLRGKSKIKPRRKDVDTARLVCEPAPVCATTTTTTTSTSSTTTTASTVPLMLPPGCGDGVIGTEEQCDPPCGSNGCSTGQLCNASCQCETQSACACGSPEPEHLKFTTDAFDMDPDEATGRVEPPRCVQCRTGTCTIGTQCSTGCNGGHCGGPLIKGGLYFGSGTVPNPLPAAVPDRGTSYTKTCCSGTTLTVAATFASETPDITLQTCSAAGCLFGAPLPILNANTSTCIINTIAYPARGTVDCTTGRSIIDLPLTSTIYLTGDYLNGQSPSQPDVPGVQPCPICTDGTCKGGPRNGLPCTAGTTALTEAYPTSHDCPISGDVFGRLPIPFVLTTETRTMEPSDTDGDGPQRRTYCAFCRDPDSSAFEGEQTKGPAVACTSNADCTRDPFRLCEQKEDGAFGNTAATTIVEVGAAGVDLTDRQPHPTTLASLFCIPPTFNGLLDAAAGLPGPGAVSLPGQAQLLP